MVDSFLVENCKPISEPLELKADADVHRAARPNVQVISRRIREDVGAIYEKVLPKEVFEHIAVMTNQNMQEKLNRAEISHKIWKKYYQLVTAEEIVQMFALLQYFRLEGGGVVWSLYKSPLNCLFTASNAFSIGNSEDQTVSNYKVSELERDILSKLSRRTLYQLVRKLGLTWEDVRESPSEAICNYLEGIEDEDQSSGSSMVSEISSEAGEAESNGDDMDSEQDEVDEADQRPV